MNSLRGKLDVPKDKHGINLVALDFQEYFFVLLDNQPVPSLTEDGVLFGQIKISHDCQSFFCSSDSHLCLRYLDKIVSCVPFLGGQKVP